MESRNPNKTILLVDDDIDFCDLIGNILENQGFKVVCSHSLESAAESLNTCNPSIILLDHNMPDGLGTEFLEKYKQDLENKYIIFITGEDSQELKEKAFRLGIFDFLPKPFHPSALNKIVYLAAAFN